MVQDRPASLYQPQPQESLSLQSSFKFHCHEGLPCFNRCCLNPTIVLSPYDILQLRGFLGITSGEFLRRYTLEVTEEFSRLPLVFIDPNREPAGCPFVGSAGCTVYPRRPAACRLFPVTMGSRLTPAGVMDYYFYRRLDFCQGCAGEIEWTVASWQANQGFGEYDRGRRQWLEILLRAGQLEIPPEVRVRDLVSLAAYDPDAFRPLVLAAALPGVRGLDGRTLEKLESDDGALLEFSYDYVKQLLFPEKRTG